MTSMRRKVSLAIILLLIAAFGIAFFQVVAPFLMPLFLAGMTAVVCQPLHRYFLMRTKNRVELASGLTTTVILASVAIPVVTAIVLGALQLFAVGTRVVENERVLHVLRGDSTDEADGEGYIFDDFDNEESILRRGVNYLNQWLPREDRLTTRQVIREVRVRLQHAMQDLSDRSLGRAAGTTFGILADIAGVMLSLTIAVLVYSVALYYFLADGAALINATEKLIPVHAKYQQQLMTEFAKVVRSVVVATFLAAFAQGVATTLALWFFGFDHLFVLFGVASISALIPMLGTWLVWLPCAAFLFVEGHWIQGSLLTVYGAVFVGFLDNVIRTYLLNTDTKIHPLLAFISILGGLQAMGLWGVFIGPIVASCLHALVKIFNHELVEFTHERVEEQSLTEMSKHSQPGPSKTQPSPSTTTTPTKKSAKKKKKPKKS